MKTEEETGVPYVHPPDMQNKPEDVTGRYCFLDASRPCGSECMAYLAVRPPGQDYEGEQWSKCSMLVNLHKVGKHVVGIASQGENLLKHLKVKRADEVRGGQPMPPRVR